MTERAKHRAPDSSGLTDFPFPAAARLQQSPARSVLVPPFWFIGSCHRLLRKGATRKLALGLDPSSSERLRLRASQLTRESSRLAMAGALEELLAGVVSPKLLGPHW